jgi:hypothetical protein
MENYLNICFIPFRNLMTTQEIVKIHTLFTENNRINIVLFDSKQSAIFHSDILYKLDLNKRYNTFLFGSVTVNINFIFMRFNILL